MGRWPDVVGATDESRLPPSGLPPSGLPPNIQRVAKLEEAQLRARTISERIAAAVTRAAGTATFAIAHLVWFSVWIFVNGKWAHHVEPLEPFDPFPFNLLTMLVSLEAIFLSIWILISQNQMTRQAERRAHLDLQINLLSEQENTQMLRILQQIAAKVGVAHDSDTQVLGQATKAESLAEQIEQTTTNNKTK